MGRTDGTGETEDLRSPEWRCAVSSAAEEFVVDRRPALWLDQRGVRARAGDRVRPELATHADDPDAPIGTDEYWQAFVGRFGTRDPGLARRAKAIARAEMTT
jgi:hypothetical protein